MYTKYGQQLQYTGSLGRITVLCRWGLLLQRE